MNNPTYFPPRLAGNKFVAGHVLQVGNSLQDMLEKLIQSHIGQAQGNHGLTEVTGPSWYSRALAGTKHWNVRASYRRTAYQGEEFSVNIIRRTKRFYCATTVTGIISL